MAKLNQQTIVVTVSEMIKDTDDERDLFTADTIASLEAVVQQLVEETGPAGRILVEIQQP